MRDAQRPAVKRLCEPYEGDLAFRSESHRRAPCAAAGGNVYPGALAAVKPAHVRVRQTVDEHIGENLPLVGVPRELNVYPETVQSFRFHRHVVEQQRRFSFVQLKRRKGLFKRRFIA